MTHSGKVITKAQSRTVPLRSCDTSIGNRLPWSPSPSSPLASPCPASLSPPSPPPGSLGDDSCRLFSQPLAGQSESHPGRREKYIRLHPEVEFLAWINYFNFITRIVFTFAPALQ